jgi:hypothetical protein
LSQLAFFVLIRPDVPAIINILRLNYTNYPVAEAYVWIILLVDRQMAHFNADIRYIKRGKVSIGSGKLPPTTTPGLPGLRIIVAWNL